MKNCVFCNIVLKNDQNIIIQNNDNYICFLSKEQETFGHTLIVSKNHYSNILEMHSELGLDLIAIIKLLNKYYLSFGYGDFNILVANGISAQQSIQHLHFHYIPRKKNDGINAWPVFK